MTQPAETLLEIDTPTFQNNFPRKPFLIRHRLSQHPLFGVSRLLELSKALPESCVEYNKGDIPLNMASQASPRSGLSAEETIRRIREAKSWMVLKYVEKDPEYSALLDQCLDQVKTLSQDYVEGMYNKEGFIFLSSPNSTTPFHVDPEHNFLLQIQGQKQVAIFDPFDELVATNADIEQGLYGKIRNLTYREEIRSRGFISDLNPGQGLHFPVAAPHWVKNGPDVSVSFSITFRSRRSERDSGIRQMNMRLRAKGIKPCPIGQSPLRDNVKHQLFRAARRVGLLG